MELYIYHTNNISQGGCLPYYINHKMLGIFMKGIFSKLLMAGRK